MSIRTCWFFLCLSIGLEVSGTTIMKASQETWPVLGMGLMYVLMSLSYFTLSKAVIKVPIGVAYAFWEGVGLSLITLSSVFMLGESIGPVRLLAICMLLLGTYLVHRGTEDGTEEGIEDGIGDGTESGKIEKNNNNVYASQAGKVSKANKGVL